jgi:hypothetical protein
MVGPSTFVEIAKVGTVANDIPAPAAPLTCEVNTISAAG